MGTYFRESDGVTNCEVCMAGAVMLGTLNVPIDMYTETGTWGQEVQYKFYAIDSFREGRIEKVLDG